MKKIFRTFLIAVVLCLMLSSVAYAGDSSARLNYVTDEAGLLSIQQNQTLNNYAAEISAKYGCSVYIITVNDYTQYSNGSIMDCASDMFEFYELGYGSDKNGVLLMLSMAERDYTLIAHGSFGNAAFTDYGKDVMSNNFLDDFRNNDWYGGFADYLEAADYLLAEASKGAPVDVSYSEGGIDIVDILIVFFLPCIIAFVVCSGFASKMKTARVQTEAWNYVSGSLDMDIVRDRFINRRVIREPINPPSQSSSNRSFSSGGGGTTINSRGFSGKSGKF